MEYGLYILTLTAALVCPWWITVPLMVLCLGFEFGGPVAVIAAILLDSLFGIPIDTLGGLAYLYTCLFGVLALLTVYLRHRIIE